MADPLALNELQLLQNIRSAAEQMRTSIGNSYLVIETNMKFLKCCFPARTRIPIKKSN